MTDPEICAAVRQHYGLAVRAVERIDRGSAALFKLYGSEAAFILKVFQPKFRADSILREVHVTDFLRQNGISVPEYISCRNGDFYFMQNGRIAILQAFIPGQTREKGCCSKRELLYDGSEIKAVLDFVNAGEVPIAWELIRSYSYMDCTFNAARLAAYTNEYRRYAEVSMDDLRYMPYLYLGQLLSSTYGYKQYLQTGDEELLAFGRWRTEMCRYLIANAGEVSAELVRLA